MQSIRSVEGLETALSDPPEYVVDVLRKHPGDLVVLGVAGKMGPTLARMARRATDAAGGKRRVIGVARFSDSVSQARLESAGVETIKADLLDEKQLARLPDAPLVIYMAGMKFGSTGNESLTWAMNTYLPGRVCQRYAQSRIAAFSTGNVYGLCPATLGGSLESDPLNPTGDYAISCVGRERMLEHFSRTLSVPVSILRLNYACELRYGVLVDLAHKVWSGQEIDVSMGCFNVIWQRDANAMALASLAHASSPPFVLNLAGPEQMSVRRACQQLGQRLGKVPRFVGHESPDAILSNGQLGHRLFGYPSVPVQQMMELVADWVRDGGASLGKPTHFEARDGKF